MGGDGRAGGEGWAAWRNPPHVPLLNRCPLPPAALWPTPPPPPPLAGGVCGTCVSKLRSGRVDLGWLADLDEGSVLSQAQIQVSQLEEGVVAGVRMQCAGGVAGRRHAAEASSVCQCTVPGSPHVPFVHRAAVLMLMPPPAAATSLPHPPLLPLPLQAGYILPCSAKPLSDCVVEVRCACMPLPGRVHYLLARMDCLPACPIAE